ncbi:hypothetical protein HZP37_18190 [Elizabethkingia anophelis]|nr:hypothetical protein [Elizabethkingia anophelis]
MDNMLKMSKEKAIKSAYGEYFIKENIDENGWTNNPPEGMLKSIPCEAKEMHITFGSPETWCRPRSITGIENNRGWTRIESEEDMPKEPGHYFVMDIFRTEPCIIVFEETLKKNWLEVVSHYQPIETPKPPIF